ncbi:kinase-like protein [Schizophyllum commune H4-8]|nr:kinase-like protein [Schizophyllum commune H4-8]KAI5899193.1 kinase-like protein [Schizophyllum commune H4-8]
MKLFLDNFIAEGGQGAHHRATALVRQRLRLTIDAARVYRAHTTDSTHSRVVAVKKLHTTKHVRNPVLRHEACVMIVLQGHPAIPEVYAWGRSQYFEYLALEELGQDLTTLSPLTLHNLVVLTCQLLDAVQFIHAHHIVHCDIKPSNVLFQRHPSGVVKLIDFGMAKLYRDPTTLQHRPQTSLRWMHGTKGFASINVHYHIRPSRRDDIESLSYTVLSLLCGGLPWLDHDAENADVVRLKVMWSGAALGYGYPPVFGEFLDYARSLRFDQEPAYKEWRKRFKAVMSEITEPPRFSVSDTRNRLRPATWASLAHHTHIPTPPSSIAEDAVGGSNDMFSPTSPWYGPVNIPDEDLVGDEKRLVSTSLGHIDEVPGMKRACIYVFLGKDERMVAE